MEKRKGLLIVNTGNGKGKTTAALGTVLRAVGYQWKVYIIQFMKGTWHYGELDGIKLLNDFVKLRPLGKGFYKILDDSATEEEHREAALLALQEAEKEMLSGDWQLMILDEVLVAVMLGLLSENELLTFLEKRPPDMYVILTGRGATNRVIELADMVTEMKEIKHPYQKGILAQKGIDF
ncbi:MAG TPA: cob(I)yrinic acid a,c-diamide adenosyltransferase [Candidatus Marinimicrobia bacterium]|nr:cob(I)yrinic acid a,c-diamide adenosyltransferase [Candidatus Neomarinimicrobiota bacterium]